MPRHFQIGQIFMFLMLFPMMLAAGTWIILYARISLNSVSSPTPWRCDVFLSFRGPDVRRGFVDHLYTAMTSAGIHVFLDAHQLNKGEDINTAIEHAIESSRIRIPIFSPDYANSVWCLNECLLISRQKQESLTVPLFYKVDPSHVRHPERSESPYSQAFEHYQNRQEIHEWKNALFAVSSLAGWSLDDTNRCVHLSVWYLIN